jgi:phospholipase D1/2
MSSKPNPPPTLFRKGVNCCAIARSHRVAVLVDGDAYFSAFVRAAERAQRSILILGWDFNSRTRLNCDERPDGPGEMGDFLKALVQRTRRLYVRVLDWDYPMLFAHERELPPLYGFGWKPPRRVHFRYDGTHPLGGSQHQKVVVIDDALAFVGGLDFTCRRWDTTEHRPDDPRRTEAGHGYPPFHDVMAAVDGEAAAALAEVARRRWRHATGETLAPVRAESDPWPESLAADLSDVLVCVACTAPASGDRAAVREVEQLYLDSIARARRYLYIENQYFTARNVGLALAESLKAREGPEIVLVTRLLSHGWLEEMTMHVLRTRLIRELREADRYGRFHVYYPHVQGLSEGTCIDVHSKLMVVDDAWLRIGSANLSNRSMGLDTECDLVVESNGEARNRRAIRGLRDRLLAEHLGVSSEAVARTLEQTGTLQAAIQALHSERRTLEPLVELTDWPDAVVDAVAIADPERPVSLDTLVKQLAPSPPENEPEARFAWRHALAVGGVLSALALAWRFGPLANLASAGAALEWARTLAAHWWAAPLLALAYAPASVVMFPRALLTLAAVVAFGPLPGLLCAIAGNLSAALGGYVAGRRLPRDSVRRIAGHRLNRLGGAFRKSGLAGVLAIRLVPLAPFVVGNLVAGAIRVRLWHFALGTFLGMLPGEVAMTILGDQLQAALQDPTRAYFWVAAGVVALLLLGAFGVGRWLLRLAQHERATDPRPTRVRPTAGMAVAGNVDE